jgi:L-alanine-DL-glutamate epimerase-like enolase superfamily enzyme
VKRRSFLALPAAAAAALPAAPAKIRISRVRCVEVRNVPTGKGLVLPWDPKQIPQDTRDYVVAQLFTDQGLIGTTMDGDYKLPAGIAAEVQKRAAAYFVGKDPFEIDLHNAEFFQKQKSPVRLFFLEIGLWDIIGQALGVPLYRLWGAGTNRVKPYAATVHFNKTPQERAEDALKFYELGFRAIKLRLHHLDPKDDLKLAETVVRAVGGKMEVMFDANQASSKPGDPPPVWDYQRALFMAIELEKLGIYWLEEPLNRSALGELARIRRQLKRMHLAGAEGDVGLARFREILTQGAFSYIQPDPVVSGPISVVRKIATMAEGFGVMFGPHHGKSGVGMLASLHMQCAAPNSGYLEYMYDPGFWNAEGFQAGFVAPWPVDKQGYVYAPSKPGLGAEWDRRFFQKHGLEMR